MRLGAASSERRARTRGKGEAGTSALAAARRPVSIDEKRDRSRAKAVRQAAQAARCVRNSPCGSAPEAAASINASWQCSHGIATSPLTAAGPQKFETSLCRQECLVERRFRRWCGLPWRQAKARGEVFPAILQGRDRGAPEIRLKRPDPRRWLLAAGPRAETRAHHAARGVWQSADGRAQGETECGQAKH